MKTLLLTLTLSACTDEIDDVVQRIESDGEVFVCEDALGHTASICWDGTADELQESTTWECRNARDLTSVFLGCEYQCPSGDGAYWSWCPYK